MSDEFLYRLRQDPPRRFALRLKARLEVQSALAVAKRRTVSKLAACGILLGTVAFAFIADTVRHSEITSEVQQSQSGVTPTSGNSTSAVPRDELDRKQRRRGAQAASAKIAASAERAAAPVSEPEVTATDSVPARESASRAAPPSQFSVLAAFADVPTAIAQDLQSSFQDSYGFPVERRLVSEREHACSRWRTPDVIVTFGRLRQEALDRCGELGARYVEVRLGYEAYVVVVNRENTWTRTMTLEDFRELGDRAPFDPITTWNQLRPEWPTLPIAVFGFISTTRSLDAKLSPAGRAGISLPIAVKKDDAEVPRAIEATYGGLGFMTFSTYEAQSKAASEARGTLPIQVVPIVNRLGDAVSPTRQTIQEGRYDMLARPLSLYVLESTLLYRNDVALFATHAIEAFSQQLDEYGFTPIDKIEMDAGARKIRAGHSVR